MEKDFDRWNELAKKLQQRQPPAFFREREIWWCSIGINIGSEIDGKNDFFERPVLILRVFSHEMVRVIPLTGRLKTDSHHLIIIYDNVKNSVILSHLKTISTKRLIRKKGVLDEQQYGLIIELLKNSLGVVLKDEISVFNGDFAEPEGSSGSIVI